MALNKVFQRFAQHSPVTVMMRGILEYVLPAKRLDQLFRKHAVNQFEDELLFSTVVGTLSLAVTSVHKSVNAAYLACREEFSVSVTALYDKLQGVETQVSQALVRDVAERLAPVITCLGAKLPPLLPGYRAKILDGNHLTGTDHRLKETRTLNSSPLPGHALVVLDPQLRLMIDEFPCEDAYAQERSLLGDVLKTVEARDLWIGDRNFCTTEFLFGLEARQAKFLIRQHGSTLWGKELVGERREIGRGHTGVVYEQDLVIDNPNAATERDATLKLRRITLALDTVTRDGDAELHLVTNVPEEHADALQLAEMYRKRWTIESAFQEIEQSLRSEVNTLCYPKAALLAFSIAVFTYNVLSTLKAAMRSAHRNPSLLMDLSSYYLADELGAIYGGMLVAIAPLDWKRQFARLSAAEMAGLLKELAKKVDVKRFLKKKRGPKKPPPQRTGGLREKHVSTARLLAQRTKKATNTT